MLPVSTNCRSDTKPEAGGAVRWLASFLLLSAIAIPCTVLFLSASSSVPFRLPIGWDPTPRAAAGEAAPPPAHEEPSDAFIHNLSSSNSSPALADKEMESEDVRLEKVLAEAAMEDRTVIVTTLNAAWAAPGSMIDLFLESFRIGNGTRGLLEHVVIVTLDPEAHARCTSIHRHCFALATDGVDFSGEKLFMTDGYLQLVWRKLDVLRMVLAKGYNFVFSDADVMWFRNPLPLFRSTDADFQTSCDDFLGDPSNMNNRPNTGFKYVRANRRSIDLYDYWYASRLRFPGRGQQGVFNSIKFEPRMEEIGARIRFWSTEYFGGMCHRSRSLAKVCTMHANCCVGLGTKLHDLKVLLGDWSKYMSLPSDKREGNRYTWSERQLQCKM